MSSDATYKPAPITLGRVTRYYELLCDLGFDEAFEAAQKQVRDEAIPKGRPVSIEEQAKIGDALQTSGAEVQLDMARIFRHIAYHGALYRLGAILFEDVSEEEAKHIPARRLEEAFIPFCSASFGVTERLLNSAVGLA